LFSKAEHNASRSLPSFDLNQGNDEHNQSVKSPYHTISVEEEHQSDPLGYYLNDHSLKLPVAVSAVAREYS
jgi:hypothetical protein